MTASPAAASRAHAPVQARGIDHLVVAVKDLDAGRAIWQALGFTLTPRAQHPWGTANSLAQLDHCFIEIVTVADPGGIKATTKRSFSFGAFNRNFLKRRQGASMIVLESADADGDIADFAAHGLETFQRFDFERMAGQPEGGQKRVAFSLAFTRAPDVKASAFFTCQQHEPDHFWHAAYQRHANTATTIDEITLVANDPADHHIFLKGFVGATDLRATFSGIEAVTPRGRIAIVTPAAFRYRFGPGSLPDARPASSARTSGLDLEIRAVTFAVADFGAAAASLIAGGLPVTDYQNSLLVNATDALGINVAFRQAAAPAQP
jgi:hypothetical protein